MKRFENFSKKEKIEHYSKIAMDATKPERLRAFARGKIRHLRQTRPMSRQEAKRLTEIANVKWVED